MDKETERFIKKTFRIPDGELLTIWRLPGFCTCPLSHSEEGVVNCPMGFGTGRWTPLNPPDWIRERLNKNVLIHCQYCQGHLRPSAEQTRTWSKVYEIIMGAEK